jgi:adenylosuccinate synthase
MNSHNVSVIVGAQWGDEGKGKITHYLSEEADLIARFGGGNNAGHTVIIGEEKYKLHHIPSGIFHPEKLCILGNGMVIDLEVLINEIEGLRKRGIPCNNIRISDRAHIVMPYHKWIDALQEKNRGQRKLGTTGRGIGPAYVDKVARTGIRAIDLLDRESLGEKVSLNFQDKEELLKESSLTAAEVTEIVFSLGQRVKNFITDTSLLIYEAVKEEKRVILEGAQGALLDTDFGTYPFVTSSNCIAGNASVGVGIPPYHLTTIIGIAKAYTTRIGTGPFPTELHDAVGDHMLKKGAEYGTTTGRPRRCGWLDLVLLKFAVRINGLTAIALTKLDILGGLNPLRVATAYRYKGTTITNFPGHLEQLSLCEPIYEDMKGWDEDISPCRSIDELPAPAQAYLEKIEDYLEVPITIVSVGAEHSQTIRVGHALSPR